MAKRVLLFEDTPAHQEKLADEITKAGCEVMAIGHANAEEEIERIRSFAPDAAVVDSKFDNDYDGVRILNVLNREFPNMPTVVCTILAGDDKTRARAYRTYSVAPGVRAVLAKQVLLDGDLSLPSADDILLACKICVEGESQ